LNCRFVAGIKNKPASNSKEEDDLGCLLAIARAEACRWEHVSVNPTIRALVYVAELGVYVAIYQVMDNPDSSKTQNRISKVSIPKSS
jgi:hypothetical protein